MPIREKLYLLNIREIGSAAGLRCCLKVRITRLNTFITAVY